MCGRGGVGGGQEAGGAAVAAAAAEQAALAPKHRAVRHSSGAPERLAHHVGRLTILCHRPTHALHPRAITHPRCRTKERNRNETGYVISK